jgi:hypothetical protein
MKLFTIGVVALLSALFFTGESDPLSVKSYIDAATGGEPINAYASSHAVIDGFSPAAEVSVEWEAVKSSNFEDLESGLKQANSTLLSLCLTAPENVKATEEYQLNC